MKQNSTKPNIFKPKYANKGREFWQESKEYSQGNPMDSARSTEQNYAKGGWKKV